MELTILLDEDLLPSIISSYFNVGLNQTSFKGIYSDNDTPIAYRTISFLDF